MTCLLLLLNGLSVCAPLAAPGIASTAERTETRAPATTRASGETTVEAVQQRRSRLVDLVKIGTLDHFDDNRQEVIFKHRDPTRLVHETGPLEDEAIASAARSAIAADYAKLNLKLRVSCAAGKLTLGSLPNDTARAASVLDTLLALDGVQSISAALPVSLRLPQN